MKEVHTINYYPINEGAAHRAKEMNSFSDYKEGSATAEYRAMVDKAAAIAEKQKSRVDPMYHEKIDHLLDTYARKLAENMNQGFAIDARVPSVMIAGPANFPVGKKEKQNRARDSNMEEWRHIQGLLDKIRSTGMGGISADDPAAIEKLQKKLDGLERSQLIMKEVNAYYRKHGKLDGCALLSPDQIEKLKASMASSWRSDPRPFESYQLTNNNAEIRRVKARIEQLSKQAQQEFSGWEFDGGRVEMNREDNRLQVFFDGKPDADTRAELKSSGFRWAPSVGAWQRQLTDNAIRAADRLECIKPLSGEKPSQLQKNLSNEQISSNNNLLGLLGQSRVPFLLQVYLAAAVLFVLVMLAGIMMIASSLNSNVAQRTEFFGLMRCIGATPKQIMRLVRKEALSWCRLAIPVGISIGIVVIWVLCAILRFLSPEFFKAMSTFGFSVPSILAGIVVGLVTVLFAAYSPAKKAAKVSPLAAVSGNANDLEPARNAANTQLLKIDTALGIYHAKANRKNLFLMTSSFALSIILFLSFSVTVEFMQHTLTPLQPWTADLSIISPDNACAIDKALLDDLKENPVVDLAYGRKFAYEVPSVTNGIEKKMDLISYEQYQFDWAKDYLLEGSLESVQTDLGTGLIVYNSQNTIQIGDTVSLNTNGQSKEIQIVGMLSDCPFYSAAGVGTIICSEDTFEQITGESKYTVIDVQLVKGTTDEDVYVIRQMVDSSFTFADERMGNSSTMGTYYCFWLFIYGFLVLIAMITIFNIINSISMSVSARLKQYGAFRAIGVSMGQLSKMIVAEAFTYTIIGGVVGTVLGLFCNKLLFGMLISYRWGDAWTPPLPEVAVILLIVVSSVILAVHGPIKRIRNMSIVDTISAQ